MTAVLAHRTITAVALAEQRLRASDLSPQLGPGRSRRSGRPGAHPLARLRRRAGVGMVNVGLRLALAGESAPAVTDRPTQRPAA